MAGSKRDGTLFSQLVVDQVWAKGRAILGQNPNEYRKDACGATIRKNLHGVTTSIQGWEIDHIVPVSKGGTDDLSNLQPLQWENNRKKGDGLLQCAVTK